MNKELKENYPLPAPTPEIGFGLVEPIYRDKGFKALPLNGKRPLVKGATGLSGSITYEKAQEWRTKYGFANTGIVADGWIAVDVDHHDDKFGADQLASLEAKHGKLPKTWKSSARGKESPSAQYFFRVESQCAFDSNPSPDIEIIHPYHRFSAVSPSKHPILGTQYIWYTPDGDEADEIPSIDEFAELPLGWVLAFSKDSSDLYKAENPFDGDCQVWINSLDSREPTPFTEFALQEISALQHIGHNDLLLLLRKVNEYHWNLWERGTLHLFEAIRNKYYLTTNEARPETEFENALRWVIGKSWEPSTRPDRTAQEIAEAIVAKSSALSDKDFWQSRNSLRQIHKLARQKVIAPFTLLGMSLIRVLNTVPYNVHYRSFRGSSSLNTLVAFVGPTGTGKSLTLDAVNSNMVFTDSPEALGGDATFTGVIEPGSGEAIPDSYMKWKKDEETGFLVKKWRNENHSGIFSFDEIGMLDGRQARVGSTIIEFMKQGWSGSVLGRELASGKGVLIPAKEYRFSMFINVQPARAGLLFESSAISGGLPSRFLFFSTQDPLARIEFDSTPAQLISVPKVDWAGVEAIDALPSMQLEHMKESFKSVDGGLPELDSHLLLSRAKVAVALAVLEGRSYLTEDDWDLSEVIIRHSKATRGVILTALSSSKNSEIVAQGRAAGIKNSIASEVEHDQIVAKVAARIVSLRLQGVPETGEKGLKKRLRNEHRKYFEEALESLNPPSTTTETLTQ